MYGVRIQSQLMMLITLMCMVYGNIVATEQSSNATPITVVILSNDCVDGEHSWISLLNGSAKVTAAFLESVGKGLLASTRTTLKAIRTASGITLCITAIPTFSYLMGLAQETSQDKKSSYIEKICIICAATTVAYAVSNSILDELPAN